MPCDNSRGGAFIGGSKWEKGGRERGDGSLGSGMEGGDTHPTPAPLRFCPLKLSAASVVSFRLCCHWRSSDCAEDFYRPSLYWP